MKRRPSDTGKTSGRIPASFLAAVIVLLAGGVGYRLLAGYLGSYTGSLPLPPGALQKIPLRIGDWQGRDTPIPDDLIPYIDAQSLLSRQYTRSGGAESANLFIAYGIRVRDFMVHRPEVCYRGAGYSLRERRPLALALPDGTGAQGEIMVFSRGSLGAERLNTVAVYYIADGQIRPDVSLARWQLPWDSDRTRYIAKVQITCNHTPAEAPRARRTVEAFVQESLPHVLERMPEPDTRGESQELSSRSQGAQPAPQKGGN